MDINDLTRAIGERVNYARVRAGLTQAQLAERVDLSATGVAKIERGEVEPRLQTLLRICEATKFPLPLLLPWESANEASIAGLEPFIAEASTWFMRRAAPTAPDHIPAHEGRRRVYGKSTRRIGIR